MYNVSKMVNQKFGAVLNMRTNKKNKQILSADASASLSLIIARIVYGVNWFNVAAIFPLIALEFSKDVSLLGSISAAFFIGIGLLQIPAGIFAWIIIAQMVGWRLSLILSGVLGLVTALLMIITIPKSNTTLRYDARMDNKHYQPARKTEKFRISDALRVLSNRTLVCLGIILIGIQAAWAVELTFIVIYLENLGVPAEIAGIIASLPLIFAIVSAPLIGGFYDKVRDTRTVLLICGVGTSMAIAGLSLGSLYLIITSVILTGFFSGGAFTVVYEKARTLLIEGIPDHRNNATTTLEANRRNNRDKGNLINNPSYYDTLKVAWVNGLSLIGVLWMPIAFSYIAEESSFELAWILSAIVTALFILVPISKLSK